MNENEEYNENRLLDLLDDTRTKINAEKRKLGQTEFIHYLLKKWFNNPNHPNGGFCVEEEGMLLGRCDDDELEDIVSNWMDTYREPDEQRIKMLKKMIDSHETKIDNIKYKIKKLKDTRDLTIEKIDEIRLNGDNSD